MWKRDLEKQEVNNNFSDSRLNGVREGISMYKV